MSEALKMVEEIIAMCGGKPKAVVIVSLEQLHTLRAALAAREADGGNIYAWMNPHNGAVIDAQKKTQTGIGSGYPNFSIPLVQAQPVAVPDGFVMVPVEPTEEMIRQARWANDCFPDYARHEKLNVDIYRAMLAAAKETGGFR